MSLTHQSRSAVFWSGAEGRQRLGTPDGRGGGAGLLFLVHAAFLGLFGVCLAAPVAATPTLEQEIRTSFEVGEAVCRRDDAGAVFQ